MVEETPHDIFGIGWDVRGWRSTKQATAVACLRAGAKSIDWLGHSKLFGFGNGTTPGFMALTEPAVGKDLAIKLNKSSQIAIAIDAPLAFPAQFQKLLIGTAKNIPVAASEIENPLAYRDCERWIKNEFGKKPLSASFDKLGNNASLAIAVTQKLHQEGYTLAPQKSTSPDRAVIEVYPGIVKIDFKRDNPALPALAKYIPGDLKLGTDEYDAAICAVLALLFLGAGQNLSLPDLTSFPSGIDREEGWIYTLPPGFIKQ